MYRHMNSFYIIYGIILITAIITALSDRLISKNEASGVKHYTPVYFAKVAVGYFLIMYYVVVVLRTVMSGGQTTLSYSFFEKGARGYVKVVFILVAVGACLVIAKRVLGWAGAVLENIIRAFAFLYIAYVVVIHFPNMTEVTILGLIALLAGMIFYVFRNKDMVKALVCGEEANINSNTSTDTVNFFDGTTGALLSRLGLWSMVFLLEGPIELYAYNKGDFVYGFATIFGSLIAGTLLFFVVSYLLLEGYVRSRLFDITCTILCVCSLCGYIQSMFFNGRMSSIDGAVQEWPIGISVVNLVVWIIVALIVVCIEYKTENGKRILNIISVCLTIVLTITLISVIFTSGVLSSDERQLVEDDSLKLTGNNDVIVFLLDAYDNQMIDVVLQDDGDYLDPLADFTYYNNMSSRYRYTNGSLPYLLTGTKEELTDDITDYIDAVYENSTFLEDIKSKGYDIRILSDSLYVEPTRSGLISNYVDKYECVLDVDKTIRQMSDCMRYKCAPFFVKPYYHYEAYSFTNIIADTDVYILGTDYAFDEKVCNDGITVDKNLGNTSDGVESAFRMYHLYGAHSPYYLTEDAKLNYNSKPLSQWKGSLKIVYDYIDGLKRSGIYNDATIIIMADHGFNSSQRPAAEAYGYEFRDESNPIFFIKRAGERHDALQIDNKETAHDDFFATIMKSIDAEDDSYGKAIWELE